MKSYVSDNLPTTVTTASSLIPDIFPENPYTNVDFLVRFQGSSHRSVISVSATATQTIRDNASNLLKIYYQDIDLLKSVIVWQKRTIDFQALHTAFLLDSMTEEEFEQESSKFMIRPRKMDPDEIARVVDKLDKLVGIPFDTSDYADYFQCTQQNVMDGLLKLNDPKINRLLPQKDTSEEK